ncbi:MAG: UbiA family prenyltransferase [Verrucomicrobiales bacterium]|nr:UbiA family prenyltransferase [Verrucomicrobiota bacterium JB025]
MTDEAGDTNEGGDEAAGRRPGGLARWRVYQNERFPLLQHGPLILMFSGCAVSYSALLRGGGVSWFSYGVAFGVCLLFFLQLRIADEFKDAEEDARWRPYRAVPRGLVTLRELGRVFVAAGVVQFGLAVGLDLRLAWVLAVGWAYLSLMCVEFFARDWLKARPVVYLISHMGIMPLVDFFATACDWMPEEGRVPAGLWPFLAASFCNGLVIEVGRKMRQAEDEEEGVETYSRLWGRKGAVAVWLGCAALTGVFAGVAAQRVDFLWPVVVALALAGVGMLAVCRGYLAAGMTGKRVELMAGGWTLVLYAMLGVVPLVVKVMS